MKTFRGSAAVGAALVFLGAAFPAEATAPSLACYWAFHSACGHVQPTAARLETCFKTHSSRLSASCGGKLPHFVAVAQRCEAEARRFCGHITRASSMPSCMQHRLAEVGQPCRKALAKVGVAAPRGR